MPRRATISVTRTTPFDDSSPTAGFDIESSSAVARVEDDHDFLEQLGVRVRELRARRGMTRKILSRDSGVSERYLAQLESGKGNISIILLRQLARALDTPVHTLVREGPDPPVAFTHTVELLRRLDLPQIEELHQRLLAEVGAPDGGLRLQRIALIGLRGAGKSTLGRALAERLNRPFVELDKEIEKHSGMPIPTLFELYGQPGFRRLERRCLEELLDRRAPMIIAAGGGLVSEASTFERLLTSCFTIWIRATPSAHMQRVIAQGDMRPMADNRQSMADLQQILTVREPLYQRADAQIETDGTPEESLDELLRVITSAQTEA